MFLEIFDEKANKTPFWEKKRDFVPKNRQKLPYPRLYGIFPSKNTRVKMPAEKMKRERSAPVLIII